MPETAKKRVLLVDDAVVVRKALSDGHRARPGDLKSQAPPAMAVWRWRNFPP